MTRESSSEPKRPKHRYQLKLGVAGHTLKDVLMLLDEFRDSIEQGGNGCAVGGGSASGFFDIKIDETMTEERFTREYHLFLDAKKDV